mmetsp:Transcript_45949/g.114222  ORF Transcript_45949/g.114222 Transcript_45949/m.114222 type:complete len:285 (+) Transcript_45949:3157-4011(+)
MERTGRVVLGVDDELFVDEVGARQHRLGVVHKGAVLLLEDPFLALVGLLLAEGHVDQLRVLPSGPFEGELVLVDLFEVLLELAVGRGAQTFVVFGFPALAVVVLFLPLLVLGQGEKRHLVATTSHFDDGCDELLEESPVLEQLRPVVVEQVDQQTFDVRPVSVLVGHDHDGSVSEALGRLLPLANLQSHDFEQVRELLVGRHLVVLALTHVQHFASEREDAVSVPAHHRQPCYARRLGRVPLSDDEGALLGVSAASVVGVLQLRNAGELLLSLGAAGLHLALQI